MSEDRAGDLRFVRRVHWLRTLGLGLGFLCVASVMRLHEEPRWLWGLLVANGFVWPHAVGSWHSAAAIRSGPSSATSWRTPRSAARGWR